MLSTFVFTFLLSVPHAICIRHHQRSTIFTWLSSTGNPEAMIRCWHSSKRQHPTPWEQRQRSTSWPANLCACFPRRLDQ